MNGQEKQDVLFNGANSAEHWMYDARLGRRWEQDPLAFEWQSPYATFDNNPVYYSDPLGATTETKTPGGGSDPDLGGMIKVDPPSNSGSTPPANKKTTIPPETYQHLDPKITQIPNSPEPNLMPPSNSNNAEFRQTPTALYKQPAWITNTRNFLHGIEQFNPVSQGWDAMSHLMYGTDKYGNRSNNVDFTYSAIGAIPFANIESGITKNVVKPYQVGLYNDLKSISTVGDGLDIHHVGQAHIYEQIIPGYNRFTAPAIAIPALMHRSIPKIRGVVAADLNPRVVLVTDALNLRKAGVPSQSILKLIDLNKKTYPGAFSTKIIK